MPDQEQETPFHWPAPEELMREAETVISRIRAGLPGDLRTLAAALPVTLLETPDAAMQADGIAPDLLGLFVGSDCLSGVDTAAPMPAQILLFLDNIWDFSEGDWALFRDEVKTTYLHELGHYLGWDEEEVEARGLG